MGMEWEKAVTQKLAAIVALAFAIPCAAEIYECRNEAGDKRFTNIKNEPGLVDCKKLDIAPDNLPTTPARAKSTAQTPSRLASARAACRAAIDQSLHDPYSAKMSAPSEWYAEEWVNGSILVEPRLRAKNAMGAYVLSRMRCVVRASDMRVTTLAQQ